jgi:hypothetical protein
MVFIGTNFVAEDEVIGACPPMGGDGACSPRGVSVCAGICPLDTKEFELIGPPVDDFPRSGEPVDGDARPFIMEVFPGSPIAGEYLVPIFIGDPTEREPPRTSFLTHGYFAGSAEETMLRICSIVSLGNVIRVFVLPIRGAVNGVPLGCGGMIHLLGPLSASKSVGDVMIGGTLFFPGVEIDFVSLMVLPSFSLLVAQGLLAELVLFQGGVLMLLLLVLLLDFSLGLHATDLGKAVLFEFALVVVVFRTAQTGTE